MSSWLPPEVVPMEVSPGELTSKPVLIVHGTADETIKVGAGRSAADGMRQFPLAVDYAEFEMGHTTTNESLAVVQAWLSAQLDV